MPASLEADVAFLHVAGGGARVTPPPGCLALTSPRRAARARHEDVLLLCWSADPAGGLSPAHADQLAQSASQAFYATPGSVTAALREMAFALNQELADANLQRTAGDPVVGRLFAAVLRGQDLYFAQCGAGEAVLVRPGLVTRLSSEEASGRPLGITEAPFVRFHHVAAHPQDLLVLTVASPPLWSDPTLSGLAGLDPARAVDRLAAASQRDLAGLLVRLTGPGAAAVPATSIGERAPTGRPTPAVTSAPVTPEPIHRPSPGRIPSGQVRRRQAEVSRRAPDWVRGVRAARRRAADLIGQAVGAALALMARLAPGHLTGPAPTTLSPRILAGTAIVVPILVVGLAAAVYYGRGRTEAFRDYLGQAQAAVVSAQLKPTAAESRGDWELASALLSQAERYGASDDSRSLRAQVDQAFDQLNLVSRQDFRPAVSGGFGSQTELSALAATPSDLYVLDAASPAIWHAWSTGRGYEMDRTFECLGQTGVPVEIGAPVDLVIQQEPGALGAQGVVAVDAEGGLLYCAPDRRPATGRLTSPDLGWGSIVAVDLFGERLYALDPLGNAVWSFDATGGLFAGLPVLYFAENVPDLSSAVDLAVTEEDLFLLYGDGRLDRCQRERDASSGQIRVACQTGVAFVDSRPGYEGLPHIPGAILGPMTYSPPPEPSPYFLDRGRAALFHYSLRLVFQGEIIPQQAFDRPATAFALGPPRDVFLAIGSEVYFAQPVR